MIRLVALVGLAVVATLVSGVLYFVRFDVRSVSWGGAELADVRIDGGVLAARRIVTGVGTLEVVGLRLRGTLGPDGLSFGLLDYVLGGRGGGSAFARVSLPDAEITIVTPDGPIAIRGDAEVRGTTSGTTVAGPLAVRVPAGGGTVHIEVASLAIDGQGAIHATVTGLHGPFGAMDPPLSIKADVHPGAGAADFRARVVDGKGSDLIVASGRTDRRGGKAKLSTPRLVFAPGGLQPARLHKRLAFASEVSGVAALSGSVSWVGGEVQSNVEVLLDNLGATVGGVAVHGVNGVVSLSGPWPLSTPPAQTIGIAAIDAGIPLTNAIAAFRLDGRGNAVIDEAALEVAGGRVVLADAVVPLDGGTTELSFAVSGVEMARLAQLADVEGLVADGTLSGTVPVRTEAGAILVHDAVLTSAAPGVLGYRPSRPPSALQAGEQGISLALQVLRDFHYRELGLTLSGRLNGGDMVMGLHLVGANPEVHDGYPVDFTLTVNGKLDQLVRRGLEAYRVPDRIRERMMKFGK